MTPAPVHDMCGGKHQRAGRCQQSVGGFGIAGRNPSFVRRQAQCQQAQPRDCQHRGRQAPMPPPPIAHRDCRRGQGEQQYRRMDPFGKRDPAAQRGGEQEGERQRETVEQAGKGQGESCQLLPSRTFLVGRLAPKRVERAGVLRQRHTHRSYARPALRVHNHISHSACFGGGHSLSLMCPDSRYREQYAPECP